MAISIYLSITLNIHGLNYLIKRQSGKWIRKTEQKDPSHMLPTRSSLQVQGLIWIMKGWEKIVHADGSPKPSGGSHGYIRQNEL